MSELKVVASRDVLAGLLGRAVQAAVRTGGSRPALTGAMLDAKDGRLVVTTMDATQQLALQLSAEVTVESEGVALVPAHLLSGYVARMPEGDVALTVDGGNITIAGDGPSFALRLLEAGDFPKITLPNSEDVEIDGDALFAAVAKVSPAVGADNARPTLTGILVDQAAEDSKTVLVATDSFRMAVAKVSNDLANRENGGQVIIPAGGGTLSKVEKALGSGKMKMRLDERAISFANENGVAVLRLIEGAYPKWESLIPETTTAEATFDIAAFKAAMARIELMAEGHVPMTMKFSADGLELKINRADVGEGGETIACEWTGKEPMTVGVNTRYIAAGVGVLSGSKARIKLIDPHKPALLSDADDDSFTYVVMPVRL